MRVEVVANQRHALGSRENSKREATSSAQYFFVRRSRTSARSWKGCSSMQTAGKYGSNGFWYVSRTSSIADANALLESGGMTQYLTFRGLIFVFKKLAERLTAHTLDDSQLDDAFFQQPQRPPRIPLRWLAQTQDNDFRFLFAVQNPSPWLPWQTVHDFS